MAYIETLTAGIDSIMESKNMTVSEMLAAVKEETFEVHLHVSQRTIRYPLGTQILEEAKALPIASELAERIEGFEAGIKPSHLGNFKSIGENLRSSLKKACIPGTSHITHSSLEDFLAKYSEKKEEWDKGVEEMLERYDDMVTSFLQDVEKIVTTLVPTRAEFLMDNIKKSMLSKEEFGSRFSLTLEVVEGKTSVALLSAEAQKTLAEVQESAVRRQVEDLITGNLQNIVDAVGKYYVSIQKRVDEGRTPAIQSQQLQFIRKATEKATADNILQNPAITDIVGSMEEIVEYSKTEDVYTALDSCEQTLIKVYGFAEKGSLLGLLDFAKCPLPIEVMATTYEML